MAVKWDVLAQIFYDGAYQHVEATADGFECERGVGDDYEIKPGKLTFRIYDDDDQFRPSNVASTLYPQIRQYIRAAVATASTVRFTGEIDRILPGESNDFQAGPPVRGERHIDFEVGGTLNRIGRRRDDLSSALFRRITSYANLRDYWSLEDGQGATQISNARAGGAPGYAVRVDLAKAPGPGGSAPLVGTRVDTTMGAPFSADVSTSGWQLHWTMNLETVDGTHRDTMTFRTANGNIWRWQIDSGGYRLLITTSDGTTLKDANYTYGTGGSAVGAFVSFRLKCYTSGSNATIEAGWNPQDTSVLLGFTESYAGALSRPEAWNIPGNVATAGMLIGHVALLTTTSDNLQSVDFRSSLNGYRGETTTARFARLMSDAGIPYLVLQDATATSQTMGPMPITTLQEQIKEIGRTEGGMVYDRGNTRGIVLATRRYLFERTVSPALTLVWPDDIAPPMQEETTAADVYNDVTVKSNAASARRTLADGSAFAADVLGEIPKTVDVNVYREADIDGLAGWWLNRYTVEGSRYPEVVVDLDAYTGTAADVMAIEPGSVIVVTGRAPYGLYLQVLRVRTIGRRHRLRVAFTVAPADIFRVGVYNTARYDVQGSTLSAGVDSTTTSVAVANASMWWGTATPYYVLIGGERMIVTAVTGTGAAQTLTVTRSTNGVVKAHPAGAEVHIGTNPGRYAI